MTAANHNYAVFILTHGRPDNVITYDLLRRRGYTGRIYLIVDDGDKAIGEYKERYGESVIVFSKDEYKGKFDIMDNFDGDKVIVYARNACYDIARALGLDYFFEYEDDYTSLSYRYPEGGTLKSCKIQNLDGVFSAMIDALNNTSAKTLAFVQGGDLIGGGVDTYHRANFKRKAMNSFVFKVGNKEDDCIFIGRMNDDVNTYLTLGKTGALFFQTSFVHLVQKETQSNKGGNTESYLKFGTYSKSFYSVIAAPSCCKISVMGAVHKRIHHRIDWALAVPKIIREAISA